MRKAMWATVLLVTSLCHSTRLTCGVVILVLLCWTFPFRYCHHRPSSMRAAGVSQVSGGICFLMNYWSPSATLQPSRRVLRTFSCTAFLPTRYRPARSWALPTQFIRVQPTAFRLSCSGRYFLGSLFIARQWAVLPILRIVPPLEGL